MKSPLSLTTRLFNSLFQFTLLFYFLEMLCLRKKEALRGYFD